MILAALVAALALATVLAAAFIALVWRHVTHVEGRALEQRTQADAMRQVTEDAARFARGRDAAGNVVDAAKVVTYARNATETSHGKRAA